jgi:peptide/nickel transport system permease protein
MRIRHVAGRMLLVLLLAGLLAGLLRGDPGVSPSLRRAVRELLAERLPVTLRGVGLGLACGWFLALSLAGPAALFRAPFFDRFGSALSGVFLCLPSALFALAGGPAPLAIGFVVFPRVFRHTRNLLIETRNLPHVLMARAKGAGPALIIFRHVAGPAASQLPALAGVSVTMALGAAIPVEVFSNVAGAGQLVWLAALGRDLPLLSVLTALALAATLIANSVARLGERPAGI